MIFKKIIIYPLINDYIIKTLLFIKRDDEMMRLEEKENKILLM